MRLAKPSVKVSAALVLLVWLVPSAGAQAQPPAKPEAAPKPAQAQQPAKPSQGAGQLKGPAKPSHGQEKPKAKPVKTKSAPPKAPEKPKAKKPAMETIPSAAELRPPARRDPFEPLVSKERPGAGIPEHLPPGKAGLVVDTLRVDGLVRAPSGMIAVVSNPQQRVYFIREGDKLYDGSVEHITMEAVTFHEIGKDAFGKPLERQVVKRLYPIAGEQ